MNSWTGLDPGGTEHLWDPKTLVDVLAILDECSPFNHMDPESPIYPILTAEMPSRKWFSFDVNNQFRPIFRRTDPWTRLGLVEEIGGRSYTTPLGLDLLEGRTSVADVFAMAAQSHVESNGDRSFARIAAALLMLGDEPITTVDIILGLNENYESEIPPIQQIATARGSGQVLGSTGRRKRSVAGMMNILVSTGAVALSIGSSQSWAAQDTEILKEIAASDPKWAPIRSSSAQSTGSANPTSRSGQFPTRSMQRRPQFNPVSPTRRVGLPSGSRAMSSPADPLLAALRLERANVIHADLVADAARLLYERNLVPQEDPNTFDAAVFEQYPCLIEVKSIHATNATAQIRKAISQLLEYRWIHGPLFDSDPRLLILVNESPVSHLLAGYTDFLKNSLGIHVLWKSGDDFVNETFTSLYDALR